MSVSIADWAQLLINLYRAVELLWNVSTHQLLINLKCLMKGSIVCNWTEKQLFDREAFPAWPAQFHRIWTLGRVECWLITLWQYIYEWGHLMTMTVLRAVWMMTCFSGGYVFFAMSGLRPKTIGTNIDPNATIIKSSSYPRLANWSYWIGILMVRQEIGYIVASTVNTSQRTLKLSVCIRAHIVFGSRGQLGTR